MGSAIPTVNSHIYDVKSNVIHGANRMTFTWLFYPIYRRVVYRYILSMWRQTKHFMVTVFVKYVYDVYVKVRQLVICYAYSVRSIMYEVHNVNV